MTEAIYCLRISLFLYAVLASACDLRPCTDLVEKGKTYVASVLGHYSGPAPRARSRPTCGDLDGIYEGVSISIEMMGFYNAPGCAAPVGNIVQAPPTVTFTHAKGSADEAAILTAHSVVEVGSCKGLWSIEYYYSVPPDLLMQTPIPHPFSEPQDGKPPPALLRRTLLPLGEDALETCRACEDYYGIRIQRL
jgi:hypothetical protein